MIEVFVIALLIYLLVVLPLIFRREIWNHCFGHKTDVVKESSKSKADNIIAESKTVISHSTRKAEQNNLLGENKSNSQSYTPLDKGTPNEKPAENGDNLEPEIKKNISATIPSDELDEAFSSDEKFDIDVAMEVDDDIIDEDVEAEELITLTGGLASGVSVEQMSSVVETLMKPLATIKEQEQTAEVIEKVRTTEMMQQVVNSIPNGELKVKQILMACEQRLERVRPKPKAIKSNKLPDDFRLEDYIN